VNCKQIAYYGKPIDTLTRDELINPLEELAGVIYDCAASDKDCSEILKIAPLKGDSPHSVVTKKILTPQIVACALNSSRY
jgi:hypothetical protein